MRIRIIVSLLALFCSASLSLAQPHFAIKVTITDSTPKFGIVSKVGTYEVVPVDSSSCTLYMVGAGDYDRGLVRLEPRTIIDNSYISLQRKGDIVYYGEFIGRLTFRLPIVVDSHCGTEFDTAKITVSAIVDSGITILPYSWPLTMSPDSTHHSFAATCQPTFDNNVFDSTLFYDFSATPYTGGVMKLQVYDSLTPITSYLAPPFARMKPLTLVFSSNYYQSFDSVLFSTKVKNHSVDSIISYFLPVTWVATASVAQGESPGEDYALPNPFTTHTTIGFTLTKPEPVKLQLFDITGRTIRETERECATDQNEIELDTRDVPPGCYWYVVHGGEWERSGKLVKIDR